MVLQQLQEIGHPGIIRMLPLYSFQQAGRVVLALELQR